MSPYHEGLSQPNRRAIRIGAVRMERFVIPLSYEGTYFLVERAAESDLWTVFRFADGAPELDCLRSQPLEGRCRRDGDALISERTIGEHPFYRIETLPEESRIDVPNGDGVSRFVIDNGRLCFGGFVSGAYYDQGDVPIGMYFHSDGRVDFRWPMAKDFEPLLD